jgi:hypothetical protein
MPTLAEMLRQGSFENPNNPYSSNLLADALRGSLSNAESLSRGAAVAPLGIFGDVNALAREYVTPRLPAKLQAALESLPAAPTTEAILANIPRGTEARRESSGMEQLGAAMNPVGPVEAAKGITKGLGAYGKLAGEAINDAMVYGRGPLAEVTPQPMRIVEQTKSTFKFPQEEAMRLAQQRAALPVEQGGLGLNAKNTALERAKAMGFRTKDKLYHGTTNPDIESFVGTPHDETMVVGTSMARDPNTANFYAGGRSFSDMPEGSNVMPLYIQGKKPQDFDKFTDYAIDKGLLRGNADVTEVAKAYAENRNLSGFDHGNMYGDEVQVLTPERIRSVNAAFDPWRRTAAIAAAMGVAAPDLLAKERK